jgi:hypothetical protein
MADYARAPLHPRDKLTKHGEPHSHHRSAPAKFRTGGGDSPIASPNRLEGVVESAALCQHARSRGLRQTLRVRRNCCAEAPPRIRTRGYCAAFSFIERFLLPFIGFAPPRLWQAGRRSPPLSGITSVALRAPCIIPESENRNLKPNYQKTIYTENVKAATFYRRQDVCAFVTYFLRYFFLSGVNYFSRSGGVHLFPCVKK